MNRKQHWEQVYATKASDSVSWFQAHAEQSLRLIHNTGLRRDWSTLQKYTEKLNRFQNLIHWVYAT